MDKFYIWDFERMMWWKGGSGGYTRTSTEAGEYGLEQATEITQSANEFQGLIKYPNTAMLPVADYGHRER